MKKWRNLSITALLAVCLAEASAQQKDSAFILIFLTEHIPVQLQQFEKEIAAQQSLDGVRAVVAKNINAKDGRIEVSFMRDGVRQRWKRRFGEPAAGKAAPWIVLGRRGSDIIPVFRMDEFQKHLKDTVILMDTVSFTLNFTTPSLDNKGYLLKLPGKKGAERQLTVESPRTLLIGPWISGADCQQRDPVRLVHKSQKELLLADFYITSPCETMLKELLTVARALQKADPETTIAELSDYVESYATDNYPGLKLLSLKAWLAENLQ